MTFGLEDTKSNSVERKGKHEEEMDIESYMRGLSVDFEEKDNIVFAVVNAEPAIAKLIANGALNSQNLSILAHHLFDRNYGQIRKIAKKTKGGKVKQIVIGTSQPVESWHSHWMILIRSAVEILNRFKTRIRRCARQPENNNDVVILDRLAFNELEVSATV